MTIHREIRTTLGLAFLAAAVLIAGCRASDPVMLEIVIEGPDSAPVDGLPRAISGYALDPAAARVWANVDIADTDVLIGLDLRVADAARQRVLLAGADAVDTGTHPLPDGFEPFAADAWIRPGVVVRVIETDRDGTAVLDVDGERVRLPAGSRESFNRERTLSWTDYRSRVLEAARAAGAEAELLRSLPWLADADRDAGPVALRTRITVSNHGRVALTRVDPPSVARELEATFVAGDHRRARRLAEQLIAMAGAHPRARDLLARIDAAPMVEDRARTLRIEVRTDDIVDADVVEQLGEGWVTLAVPGEDLAGRARFARRIRNGRATIDAPAGRYTLRLALVGYRPVERDVELSRDRGITLTLTGEDRS